MYLISRYLEIICSQIKAWCLDNKQSWGLCWKHALDHLQQESVDITTIKEANTFRTQHHLALNRYSLLVLVYQRMQGDLPTRYFFNKLKQRRNHKLFAL